MLSQQNNLFPRDTRAFQHALVQEMRMNVSQVNICHLYNHSQEICVSAQRGYTMY